MILIVGVYLISKYLPIQKNEKELLEAIYKQASLSDFNFRNLKF